MNYRIAINEIALTGKLPPGDSRWARFNDSFVNREIESLDIANAVYVGYSYAAWHNGRRKDENFICGQHIAVDMESHDERSSIPYLMSMEFVRAYGSVIHTTPSHKPDDPRARVIFLLDQPITDAAAYEAAIAFVYGLFPGSDTACIDSSRFFYGAKDCHVEWLDNVLPLGHLRSFYARWGDRIATPRQRTVEPPPPVAVEQQPVIVQPSKLDANAFLAYAIQDASGEGRNNRGYRLARQLKEVGLSLFEAEGYMRQYQRAVERNGPHNYTEQEALNNLRSAYSRSQMVH